MWMMKYLKYYESKITRTKEISDYCEYNLAYLLDDDYYYKVSISRKAVLQTTLVQKIILTSDKSFDTIAIGKKYGFFLDDIRSEIISTVAFLDDKYGVNHIYYVTKRGMVKSLDKDSIEDCEDISMRTLYIIINK
jgi:hypothetical protein